MPQALISARISRATTSTAAKLAPKGFNPVCLMEANLVSKPTPAMLIVMQNFEICYANTPRLTL